MPNPPLTPDEERAATLAEKVEQDARGVTERVEERAKKLEEQRVDHAEALEEQRADQASALEDRRIEHRIEERREQQADLKTELHGIVEAIATLIQHMDQSLPEERVKQLAEAVLAEERVGRKRLATKITGFLVVIVLLVASSLLLGAANRNTLAEAKVTSDYVRKCIQHPQNLTPEEKLAACGPPAAVTTNFIKYLNCALQISPEARTDENLSACAGKAFGVLK